MAQNKRYQVFVSSTFLDLEDERKEIMQALLELECIPAGMELFPASDDESWNLIKKVIEDSDYYIVVLAGRYGTIGPDGLSYTEMEYRYASEKNIPILGFLHENPDSLVQSKSDTDPTKREKMDAFRKLVGQKHVKRYNNPTDLGGKVSRALVSSIKAYPRDGWIRWNKQMDEAFTQMNYIYGANMALRKEVADLRVNNEELKKQLEASRIERIRHGNPI